MAFLCPVRIKRNKKKKPLDDDSLQGPVPSMGRITGSASIETLVRVGIEKENGLGPESKMVVLHDFTPCVDDELEVKRGQIVHVLYQENDWVYVISEANQEGFIPHSYCAQYGSQLAGLALNVKKKLPRDTLGPPPGQTTMVPNNQVTPPPASSSASAVAAARMQMARYGGNPPPDVLNTGSTMAPQMSAGSRHESDHNVTLGTTVTSTSMGRVNPGMEHSDSDSFHDGGSMRPSGGNRSNLQDPSRSNSLMSETSSQPDIHPFFKDPSGRYVVLYSYSGQDENDLNVERGQCVTVLNCDDPDWYWVSKFDGREGFVPAGFIYPLDAIQRQQGLNSGHRGNNAPTTYTVATHHFSSPTSNGIGGPPLPAVSTNSPHYHHTSHSQNHTSHLNSHPWSGGSAGSSGPPSFSNSGVLSSANVAGVTSGGMAGDLVHGQMGLISTGPPLKSPLGQQHHQQPCGGPSPMMPSTAINGPPPLVSPNSPDLHCYNGTELVMLYDYKAQAPDDLSVRRGDWVYADLNNQTVDGWLWTYAPKTRKYGFIPRAYAKPPAMTSL